LVCSNATKTTTDGVLEGEHMGFRDRFVERLGYAVEVTEPFVPTTQNRAMTAPAREAFVVNESTALALVPVSRAISVLETAIMNIPVEVYRGNEQIATPAWLEYPDIENNVSQSEWLGTTLFHMAVFGNAFWLVRRGNRGIVNITNIHPTDISVLTDERGVVYYTIGGNTYSTRDIVHLKLWKPASTSKLLGEGPIQRHKSVLRSALDLHNYADNWFRTAAVPTGALTTTEFLSEDVAKQNKEAFIASQQERSVAVLSSGLKYESISLNPEQAQFLENQKFINRQIALMFGVPPMYLSMAIEGQGMTYINGNEDRARLYDDGLQQYIVRIQQAITDLLPRGQKAEFNLTEFLRPNQNARYNAYATGLSSGFLTVDEVREMEGMTPLDEQPAPTAEEPIA
jgi:HK97 family phage portal protein